MTGIWVLAVAIVVTFALALLMRRRNGRFREVAPPRSAPSEAMTGERLTAAEIGGELGSRVSLVQFSSAFCSPCRATRALLHDVVAGRSDVRHVEIDAEAHLDLVRRLGILRTPTVLVLDGSGRVVGRASGLPSRDQVEAAIAAVGGPSQG
ncbi:hypothetical protein HMPREF0063_11473 [Aeromicrobium marinum DSM 15272]|uniref:Thioredoxin domain-containing protein n=1 Tax=Aeromicrobium marinum DSM 15272 TaxID=585531 RepID=E2SBR4_9ACTN|nr:thioredoxin family protein [Aeromicrobium marinum]EFQ83200.1 hypothetical protein HMPREF0063_11473 [Aeromicrobium marinum DSM 15272]